MSNILKAFVNIVNNYQVNINIVTSGNNRANNMGEGLESYISDAFSDNFNETDLKTKKENFRNTFSYKGTKNRIPDLILKNSDAIEIKKTEVLGDLQLNSSHPKAKLYSIQNITDECRACENENWDEKDIIYAMGHIPKRSVQLKSIWFVYGTCYAADKEVYKDVEVEIKSSLNKSLLSIETTGKELGKVKSIDSLNLTYLRIRGMWVIKHPSKLFADLYQQTNESFSMVAIIPINKYNNLPREDREIIEQKDDISISDENISNPNNSAQEMKVKLLIFKV
ncbi:MAG: Type II site-specific deoxyribonuclease [uncultured Sulfurovum sp.]|uniref:Type II site-specific deoxyribonuclease n=1 Tax=uncultured Sulfurovum sp. TaxID=269237 RepID=A0A6S6T0A5_9BACT|nr:MAG: Type II site-specific deoxyribonuclease [uncultured Sulfurovum sp.]